MSKALRTNVKPDVSKWEPALEFEGSTETVELPNGDNQKEACQAFASTKLTVEKTHNHLHQENFDPNAKSSAFEFSYSAFQE